ncbi:hypothetical protein FORMB_15870 [Formosa sp. Hel1_33_131]|uniref:hypothetical protein n=1 Tax=Formosa sp. Hel1_33_131 TaxID=1336794 RepID=UPI00084E2DCD|nr:hypothetical protein [Formosa sp. Hel1_33_131]AOR28627.1 hypothetical protein FORMB_15870 [Formosa sp. Hel1_33_131]
MKNIIGVLLFLVTLNISSQEITKNEIIGKWNFINMIDTTGKIITERKFKLSPQMKSLGLSGIEKIQRPDMFLGENGEYINYLKGKESESGFWEINENNLRLRMRISPNDKHLKSLKKYKVISKKSKDGFYYQKPIKKEIKFMQNDSLVINENTGYLLIYKRE